MNQNNHQVVVIGKESSGKSQLISSLTSGLAYVSNFRGSTVSCEVYPGPGCAFVDTPGILRQSDTVTTRAALSQLEQSDTVLLVLQATHIDDDLGDLLPLTKGKQGLVVVTFWDKIDRNDNALQALDRLSQASGLRFIPVDARNLTDEESISILSAIKQPSPITCDRIATRVGWRIDPPPTLLENRFIGPLAALVLLLLPAIFAITIANSFAGLVDPIIKQLVTPISDTLQGLPSLLKDIFVGRYGLLTMGPLLFVWSVPTVVLYALFLGSYKASGLLDRITVAMHPIMRPFGLNGRDLVRVIMGFGCNVPAVVNTRACSACSRSSCIAAIAFGSACSYQLGATLAVFAAAGLPLLVIPYLLFLTTTTLIYTRLSASSQARSPLNVLVIEHRVFLEWPHWTKIWQESRTTLVHFFKKAVPVFSLITVIASILDWLGAINAMANIVSPLMALFHLPTDAALPVVLASIRKDGILLFAEQNTIATMTPGQILVGVYLAGVLLPCLVTALTIAHEQSTRFVVKLMCKQMLAACCFSLILAWVSFLLGW
jgi:ferrous iron transport protein B